MFQLASSDTIWQGRGRCHLNIPRGGVGKYLASLLDLDEPRPGAPCPCRWGWVFSSPLSLTHTSVWGEGRTVSLQLPRKPPFTPPLCRVERNTSLLSSEVGSLELVSSEVRSLGLASSKVGNLLWERIPLLPGLDKHSSFPLHLLWHHPARGLKTLVVPEKVNV